MKKNKSIFCCVVIMLSACGLQPLNAVVPFGGNRLRGDSGYMMCFGVAASVAVTAGLYGLGKYYEKKKPLVTSKIATGLICLGMPGKCLEGVLGHPMGFPMWLTWDWWSFMQKGTLPITETIKYFGLPSSVAFYAGMHLQKSIEEVENRVHSDYIGGQYSSLRKLIRKNPVWVTTESSRRPLIFMIAHTCSDARLLLMRAFPEREITMLYWLLRLDKKNMHVVDRDGNNVVHYIARNPMLCSSVLGERMVKVLDAKALNQKDKQGIVPLKYLIDYAEDGNKFAEKTKLMKIMLDNGADMGSIQQYFNEKASRELKDWYADYLLNKDYGASLVFTIQEKIQASSSSDVPSEVAMLISEYALGTANPDDLKKRMEGARVLRNAAHAQE